MFYSDDHSPEIHRFELATCDRQTRTDRRAENSITQCPPPPVGGAHQVVTVLNKHANSHAGVKCCKNTKDSVYQADDLALQPHAHRTEPWCLRECVPP